MGGEWGRIQKIIWSLNFAILHTFIERFKYQQVILELDSPQFQAASIRKKIIIQFFWVFKNPGSYKHIWTKKKTVNFGPNPLGQLRPFYYNQNIYKLLGNPGLLVSWKNQEGRGGRGDFELRQEAETKTQKHL